MLFVDRLLEFFNGWIWLNINFLLFSIDEEHKNDYFFPHDVMKFVGSFLDRYLLGKKFFICLDHYFLKIVRVFWWKIELFKNWVVAFSISAIIFVLIFPSLQAIEAKLFRLTICAIHFSAHTWDHLFCNFWVAERAFLDFACFLILSYFFKNLFVLCLSEPGGQKPLPLVPTLIAFGHSFDQRTSNFPFFVLINLFENKCFHVLPSEKMTTTHDNSPYIMLHQLNLFFPCIEFLAFPDFFDFESELHHIWSLHEIFECVVFGSIQKKKGLFRQQLRIILINYYLFNIWLRYGVVKFILYSWLIRQSNYYFDSIINFGVKRLFLFFVGNDRFYSKTFFISSNIF